MKKNAFYQLTDEETETQKVAHTGGWRQGWILTASSFCIQNSGLKEGNGAVWGVNNREIDGDMAANRWACRVPIGGRARSYAPGCHMSARVCYGI